MGARKYGRSVERWMTGRGRVSKKRWDGYWGEKGRENGG